MEINNETDNSATIPFDSLSMNPQFLETEYPKILAYIPNKVDNKYVIKITDYRVQHIQRLELKLQLPEIKGEGKVAYMANYNYHLIKNFKIFISNNTHSEKVILHDLSSEDLYINGKNNPLFDAFHRQNGGEDDEYCITKEGLYSDCVIFPSRRISIPIHIFPSAIDIFDKTNIIFEFELNNIENILTYNRVFEAKALKNIEKLNNSYNMNINLEFSNSIKNIHLNNERISAPSICTVKKHYTINPDNTKSFNTHPFVNSAGLIFSCKTNIFDKGNYFITNIGAGKKEKELIYNFNKRILESLIVISDLDMTQNINKRLCGFPEKAQFELVVDNIIYFDNEKRKYCNIHIANIPSNKQIYYHKNILTFSRHFDKNNILNISELFKTIKGIYYDTSDTVYYLMEDLEHMINIGHISIPIEIWDHSTNTETGDLRKVSQRDDDFCYRNPFIFGMDFLSKDKGYKNVSVAAGRDTLTKSYHDTAFIYHDLILKTPKFDINNYPHSSVFYSYVNDKHIKANPKINFNKFLVTIDWNEYMDHDPKKLYDKYPIATTVHFRRITYDFVDKTIEIDDL